MTDTTETVKQRGNTIRVIAGRGYCSHVKGKALASVRDTGNGWIARFPSFRSVEQDHYVCLDYAEAHSLWLALSKHFEGEK